MATKSNCREYIGYFASDSKIFLIFILPSFLETRIVNDYKYQLQADCKARFSKVVKVNKPFTMQTNTVFMVI